MELHPSQLACSSEFKARCLADAVYRQRVGELMDAVRAGSPGTFADFNQAGNHLLGEGAWEAARQAYSKGFKRGEGAPMLWNNIGFAFETQGDIDSAIQSYEQALKLDARHVLASGNLHSCLVKKALTYFAEDTLPAMEKTEQWLYRAMAVNPRSGWATLNLGNVAIKRGLEKEAEFWYRQSIAFDSNPATARSNLAHLLMRQGRFEEGLDLYETRRYGGGYPSKHAFFPVERYWDGVSPLDGKTLYLHWEQGFGDMIQYVRYTYLLRDRYPEVCIILDTMPELVPLFKQLERTFKRPKGARLPSQAGPVDFVIANDDRAQWESKADHVFALMSLAKVFTRSIDSIYSPCPYLFSLRPRDELAVALDSIGRGRAIVGLLWAGRPTHGNDKHRSIHLKQLAQVVRKLAESGCRVVSLQMGDAVAQIASCGLESCIINLGSLIKSFADTSAILARLDHFITVDSANLHLAGAMGIASTALIPVRSDFRWFEKRADTPWYPTVSLFRQVVEGEWGHQLESELLAFVSGHNPRLLR